VDSQLSKVDARNGPHGLRKEVKTRLGLGFGLGQIFASSSSVSIEHGGEDRGGGGVNRYAERNGSIVGFIGARTQTAGERPSKLPLKEG